MEAPTMQVVLAWGALGWCAAMFTASWWWGERSEKAAAEATVRHMEREAQAREEVWERALERERRTASRQLDTIDRLTQQLAQMQKLGFQVVDNLAGAEDEPGVSSARENDRRRATMTHSQGPGFRGRHAYNTNEWMPEAPGAKTQDELESLALAREQRRRDLEHRTWPEPDDPHEGADPMDNVEMP